MIFSRDASGYSVAVIKDLPVVAATYVNGALLKDNNSAGAAYAEVSATTWVDLIGLYVDAGATTTGTVAAGTLEYKKVVINPDAIYMAEYENNTTNNITAVAYSAGTWTITSETSVGDWLYHTDSLAGAGLLMYIGSTNAAASFSSVATPTAATPPASANIIMHIHGPMKGHTAAAYGRIDLTADGTQIDSASSLTGTGLYTIESYYSGRSGGLEPLRFATHDNTVDTKARFFSEIIAVDHVLKQV